MPKKLNVTADNLDAVQKAVAEEIAFKRLTGRTEQSIADEYGINRSTIWRWKSLPAFNDAVNNLVKEYQRSNLVDVNGILIDILENGTEKSKLKAIELYYRNQGLFRDSLDIKDITEDKVDVEALLNELKDM